MTTLLASILAVTIVGAVAYYVYERTVVQEEKRMIKELERRDEIREREQDKDYEQWLGR